MTSLVLEHASPLTIRKAATIAHWVPGVDLLVYQTDWPPLSVSTQQRTAPDGEVWLHVHPCLFRHALTTTDDSQDFGIGPTLGRSPARLEIDARETTKLHPSGLFEFEHGHDRTLLGFVTMAEIPIPVALTDAAGGTAACKLDATPDPILETQLISSTHLRGDGELAESVTEHVMDALVAMAADEAITVIGLGA